MPRRPRTLGAVGLLVELLLPTTLAAPLLLIVAGRVPFWNLRTSVGLGVFVVLLVVICVVVSVRVDVFTLPRRRRRAAALILNRPGPWSRLVKFILGGLVIPAAAFVGATRIELPGRETPMTLAIRAAMPKSEQSAAARLGSAIVRAATPAAKVEGIRALQAIGSDESLEQLLRILSGDPSAVAGGEERRALTAALASFGSRAQPRLLQLFRQVPEAMRRNAPAPPGALFERYFAGPFEGAKGEIERRNPEAAARGEALARLQAARDELRRALDGLDSTPAASASGLPGVVMEALLEMSVERDAGLLAFAVETAGDATWSEPVRGQALLLIGKLGGPADLPRLYPYMEGTAPVLQACALRAAAELEGKGTAAAGK